jgi:hypothetical protein
MNHLSQVSRFITPGLWFATATIITMAALMFLFSPPVYADENQDTDPASAGLVSIADSKFDELLLKPGVDLSSYGKVIIEEPTVSMIAHWRRTHRDTVTKRDEEKIKADTAARLKDELTKKLSEGGGLTIVEEKAEGVLLLKPAIINMNIYAPDTGAAGRRVSLVHSAGHATLELEIYDAASGELLAKARDHRDSDRWGSTHLYRANRATNNREFRQIMSVWGERLREQLQRSG